MGKAKNKMLDDDNMAHNTKVVDITKRKENKNVMDNKMVNLEVKKVLDDISLTLFGKGAGGGAYCAPPPSVTYLCIYIFSRRAKGI